MNNSRLTYQMYYYLLICGLILTSSISLSAQNYCSLSLKKDTAFIGDPVFVNIKIVKQTPINTINLSGIAQMSAMHDSTQNDISIDSYGKWKVDNNYLVDMNSVVWVKNSEGKEEAYTQLELKFWDNGQYRLPQINITNSMPIESPIITIFAPQDVYKTAGDSTMAIMPIKSIIKEKRNFYDYLPAILGLLGLLLIGGLFYYFNNKKRKINLPVEVVPEKPPHEIAYKALDNLAKKQLWQNGKIKEYQSQLTHIIRAYLSKRYQIDALENTTENIIESLKKTDFDDALKSNVANILQMADMIKFAKAKPSDDIHQTFWNQAKQLVDKTKQIVQPQENI